MKHPSLPTTESAVSAVREIADGYRLTMTVTHDIGADQTSRRSSAELFKATDPDGSLPHEAFIDLPGRPAVSVRLFPEDDALISVDGVEFHDVPRDSVPAFLRSVYGGLAHVTSRFFPPGYRLTIPLPGDETYREPVPALTLTPWLSSVVRP
ncbi:hypothetical protein GCM10010347_46600 [Streptomyces cirratus]|uniref:Uncharacterized protein n=1 Tax=Streptomyces cirratus TaxID=68187 RepID=A0ABQ3EXF5_9ACTN|nr:hypothetical protein [Streptomyces cirratus]GHB71054.1 hypothetical protein GCM10010347_46600 [Streptomyces cirratus]